MSLSDRDFDQYRNKLGKTISTATVVNATPLYDRRWDKMQDIIMNVAAGTTIEVLSSEEQNPVFVNVKVLVDATNSTYVAGWMRITDTDFTGECPKLIITDEGCAILTDEGCAIVYVTNP